MFGKEVSKDLFIDGKRIIYVDYDEEREKLLFYNSDYPLIHLDKNNHIGVLVKEIDCNKRDFKKIKSIRTKRWWNNLVELYGDKNIIQ